jgi:Ca-activated chloride channel family protein
VLFASLVAAVILLAVCMIGAAVLVRMSGQPAQAPAPATGTATLTVACSPEKEALFTALVADFNRQNLRTPDRQPMRVEVIKLDPEAMIGAALDGKVQAISPDSSIWLDQLDAAWRGKTQSEAGLVGETRRYATTPVVLAMWEDVAREMGYPAPIGWTDLLARAKSDPNFKWSHPSTTTASGLLATLAEFYAGAGLTRGLTEEAARAQPTLDYVAAIEKTVRFYGEGELAVIERARAEGRGFLNAFVVSEQLVIDFNRKGGRPRLIAVYPKEGTLWQDHPLALLEQPGLTNGQRLTFAAFRDTLLSAESQKRILDAGYRPADLNIPLDFAGSPISPANGADPKQPQTTLQIPSPGVVQVVRDVWFYTKRKTNVVLVVDTSGSMQGQKLANAQAALRVFLGEIKGDQERVGLIEFASDVKTDLPLVEIGQGRTQLESTVDRLEARGDTALLDAVSLAYDRLQQLGDRERINAIVAMTDGRENHSQTTLSRLTQRIRAGNQTGVPVVIFCIAYGDDADMKTLQAIADASGGQVRKGDLETIRQLYKILSTYF